MSKERSRGNKETRKSKADDKGNKKKDGPKYLRQDGPLQLPTAGTAPRRKK